MTSYLSNVKIFGLWGEDKIRVLDIDLDERFNFIIGRNGTGKTTVINLIAAALTADFERLDKISFGRIVLTLRPPKGRFKPSIEIEKTQKSNLPFYDITYKTKSAAGAEPTVFDLDALEEEMSYRGIPPRHLRDRIYKDKFVFIRRQLADMVNISWLSVNRFNVTDRSYEERERRSPLSAVDQKLESMKISLIRYFSKLATQFSEETANFQKTSFLSLITIQRDSDFRSFVEKTDIQSERKSLESMLELLGVDQKKYNRQLDHLVSQFNDAKAPLTERSGITMQQLTAIIQAYKTHSLVQLYEELQERKKAIFLPKENFLDVLNNLFQGRKSVSISEQNELQFKGKNNNTIEIEDLSSGEKQLLIILGEALLQESKPVIYIADEPELSLHVEWQELLTVAISKLNPNAQIVFATHSPDIVGIHQNKIINMERAFS